MYLAARSAIQSSRLLFVTAEATPLALYLCRQIFVDHPCQIRARYSGGQRSATGDQSSLPNEHPDQSSQVKGHFYSVAGQGFKPWKASANGFTVCSA